MIHRKEDRGASSPERRSGPKARAFCAGALAASVHLSLFLYLTALPFGSAGLLAAAPAFLLLVVFLVLTASMRFGASPRRVRAYLSQRMSGAPLLCALPLCYLLCALLNLTYSPLKARMLEAAPAVAGGLLLWAGVLFYAEDTDRMDNLLMDVAAAGLVSGALSLGGVRAQDGRQAMRVILIGIVTGAVFFLSAQYNRTFKAVVTAGFAAMLVPSLGSAAGWAAPAALTQSVFAPGRQGLFWTAVDRLETFTTPEVLLGRGSGYDLTLSGGAGVPNFLLADLMDGGVVRFALSLSLWLCVGYCVCMLFLYERGIPVVYLCALGMVFVGAFLTQETAFLSDPLFLTFCALLAAEHTLIKKGKRRARL